MRLSKADCEKIRTRLERTDGGIKRAAALGGISEQVAHKILDGGNCRQTTIDAFYEGINELEVKESARRKENSRKAKSSLLV